MVPPVPSALVVPVVVSWLAPTLPRNRYKILPAQLLGGENGIKLSLHVEKAPNRAISGEQGEFCTGSGAARLVLGEFCFVVAPSVYAVAGFPPPTGAPSWPSAPAARSTLVAVGVLHYTKPSTGVSPACRTLL